LDGLRGKNVDVVQAMMSKVMEERKAFDQSIIKFQATRSVFANLSNELFAQLGMDSLKEQTRGAYRSMLNSKLSTGLRDTMRAYFAETRSKLERSGRIAAEIGEMMAGMYKKFADEHNLKLNRPLDFSTLRYLKELDRVEASYNKRFGSMVMVINSQYGLTDKFFEVIASRIREAFEIANRDAESWLKAVMAPIEGQMRERQLQLRRRLDSIKRIHQASDTLDERIVELKATTKDVEAQALQLDTLFQEIEALLHTQDLPGFDLSL
jgi:hypothetical protein